jgi:hypothetical protein
MRERYYFSLSVVTPSTAIITSTNRMDDAAVAAGFHHCEVHTSSHVHCYYRAY